MKRFSTLVLAGAIGAAITLAASQFIGSQETQPASLAGLAQPVGTHQTLHTSNTAGAVDFVVAAERAMPVVVQIRASESDALAQQRRQEQRRNDPWSRFFDFGFGDDFFGFPFQYGPRSGAGSGVILTSDGYIVTNNHVVDFADEVLVKTFDGEEYEAQIIGRDPASDLAVIKVEAKNLPVIELGDSDNLKIGEWVLAVGNPFEYLTSTVTAGIVSAVGRDIDIIRGERAIEQFIQTDAAINPGNSGGALVDSQGRLVGINTAIASNTGNYAGYSFAIPVNLMTRIVDDIIESGGVIQRTNLGVIVEEVDAEYAKDLEIGVENGLIIQELENGSAAQYAGLLPKDIIVAVDNKEVKKFDDLKKIVEFAKVGDTLMIKVYREGDFLEIPVRLRGKM
jgi:serine protease Do